MQPYCVKVFKQRWYVTGFCRERNALRTFSLDRIHSLTVLPTKFVYPADFDPAAYFASSFGIIAGDDFEVETVRLKVGGMHRLYVRALPLHPTQREVVLDDWYSVFECRMKPTFDLKQELLSRGDAIEVLAPQSLRDEIAKEIENMRVLYASNK